MLLRTYNLEISRPECNPGFESLHGHAHLDQDVAEVLPFLNRELGGFEYTTHPPSVTFRAHGKLITVHPRLIAVNALRDRDEADKIVAWLQGEINRVWAERDAIEPKYDGAGRPGVFEILKRLPRTNCRACGRSTCMVFAAQAAEGVLGPEDCPDLDEAGRDRLKTYLSQFPGLLDD